MTNNKYQIPNKLQIHNFKIQTLENWSLMFICNLVLGIWNLRNVPEKENK